MVRQFEAHVVTGTTPTSTGTKDFTVSGVGGANPVGAIIYVVRNTADDTEQIHASASWGVTDGTDELAWGGRAEHNVSTTNTRRYDTDTACIALIDSGSAALDVEAVFDSWVSGGIRLDFTTVDSSAYKMVILLLFGTDCECAVFKEAAIPGANRSENIDVGFTPSFICGNWSDGNWNEAFAVDSKSGFAFSADEGGTNDNAGVWMMNRNNATTTDEDTLKTSNRVAWTYQQGAGADSVGLYQFIEDIGNAGGTPAVGADGFDITSSGPDGLPTPPYYGGMAVRCSDRDVKLLGNQQVTTSGGTLDNTTGFRVGTILWMTARNANNNNTAAQCFGVWGFWDFSGARAAISWNCHNNISTSNCTCRFITDADLALYNAVGNLEMEADFINFDSTGYDVDFTNNPAATRRYITLSIEEQPFTGTAGVSLGSLTASGSGALSFDANAAVSLPSLQAAATGQSWSGSAAVSLPSLTAAGTANEIFSATGAATLPSLTAAATATTLYGTAAVTLPSLTAAGTANEIFSATGAATLPALTAAGTAQEVFSATGAALLPGLTAAGTGTTLYGSGAVALPALTAASSAQQVFSASASVALPSLTSAATAQEVFTANATAAFGSLVAASNATVVGGTDISARGAALLPGLLAAGTAQEVFSANGAALLPGLTSAGSALIPFTGSGAAVLPSLTAAGVAQEVFSATATASLGALTAVGDAVQLIGISASADVTLPSLQAASVAKATFPFFGIGPDSCLDPTGAQGGTYLKTGAAGGTFTALGTAGGTFKALGTDGGTFQILPQYTLEIAILTATGEHVLATGNVDACKRLVQDICVVRGDDGRSLQFTFVDDAGDPIDWTGASAKLVVDPDPAPDNTDNNLFEIAGVIAAPLTGVIVFTPSKANSLQTPGVYFYDVQVTLSGGEHVTVATGQWTVEADIADAGS